MPPTGVRRPAQPRLSGLLAGLFGCELAAAVAIGLAGRPGLGLLFVGGALCLGLLAARRFARATPAPAAGPLVAAWTGAARAAADGAPAVAVAILEAARARTGLDGPTARLLIELHASSDEVDRAVEVALENLHLLAPDDVFNMIASLESWGERRYAAALAAAVGIQRTATTNSRGNGNSRLPSMRAG
jgi:hypothetical protein